MPSVSFVHAPVTDLTVNHKKLMSSRIIMCCKHERNCATGTMRSKKEDQISQLSGYCSFVFRRSQVYISIWRLGNVSKIFNWVPRYHQGSKSSYDCFLPHPAFLELLNYHKNSVSKIYYRKLICFNWIKKFLIITKFIEYAVTTSVFGITKYLIVLMA